MILTTANKKKFELDTITVNYTKNKGKQCTIQFDIAKVDINDVIDELEKKGFESFNVVSDDGLSKEYSGYPFWLSLTENHGKTYHTFTLSLGTVEEEGAAPILQ